MELSKTEAKCIVSISKLENEKRSVHGVAAALNQNFFTTYHCLQILVEKDALKVVKSGSRKKNFYMPTPEAIEEAEGVLHDTTKAEVLA